MGNKNSRYDRIDSIEEFYEFEERNNYTRWMIPAFESYINCRACHSKMLVEEAFNYDDGRQQCRKCVTSAILDTTNFEALINEVHEFYASVKLEFPKNIKILMVDAKELQRNKTPISAHVVGRFLLGGTKESFKSVIKCSKIGKNVEATRKSQPGSNVSTVLVLHGFPKILTGGILAHELMHVFLRSRGCEKWLKWETEEAMCNVISSIWVDWYIRKGHHTEHATRLAESMKFQYSELQGDVFGDLYRDSYREFFTVVRKYGHDLKTTMRYIIRKKGLPKCD